MDEAAVSQVNNALDKVRQRIENLEKRAVAQNKFGEETARRQAEWARTQIDLDTEHAKIFSNATEVLSESTADNQIKLKKLAAADEENAWQREADCAEIAEIRDATAELRKTLAAIPEEKSEAEHSVLSAKSKLEHRLNSALQCFYRQFQLSDSWPGFQE
jgi:predicted  nucleic acid-binding Zn-ribbon protein